jgi:hypothetical protein
MPASPERIEWLALIVYEPGTGRVCIEEEDGTFSNCGFLKEGLDPEIAWRMIKTKLVFL